VLADRADPPVTGEPDIRYAKVVALSDTGQPVHADADGLITGSIITLQFRPHDGRWRIHAFGDHIRPEHLPPAQ
jgi:hypothetical protein